MTEAISVKLPPRLKAEIDEMVRLGAFISRSDALKYGARLAVMLEKQEIPLSARAEEYAVDEIRQKFKRIKNVH